MTNGIEVFVLSRNRRSLLVETLRSLTAQQVAADRIVVLDNCSEDDTVEVVCSEFRGRVEVAASDKPLTVWENFARAAQLARCSHCMVAHDDDLYHPGYLGAVKSVLEKYPRVGLVIAGMSYEYRPDPSRWRPLTLKGVHCSSPNDLALKLYNGFGANFGSTIFRADLLKELKVDFARYANYSDRPLLLEVARKQGAFVLEDRYVQYRLHQHQDSATIGRTYPAVYLLNLQECYRDFLLGYGFLESLCYRYRQFYNVWSVYKRNGSAVFPAIREVQRLDPSLAAFPLGVIGFTWYRLREELVAVRMFVKRHLKA